MSDKLHQEIKSKMTQNERRLNRELDAASALLSVQLMKIQRHEKKIARLEKRIDALESRLKLADLAGVKA